MLKALAVLGGSGAALYGSNKYYFSGGKCYETGRLDGKFVIVTGANTGIGKETAAELARRGANVIMACRNIEKAKVAKMDILSLYGKDQSMALTKNVVNGTIKAILSPVEPEQLIIEELDLSSLKSIREFADRISKKIDKLDVLINNAGIMACPYAETDDGFESQIGTNHLGPFLLTELLLPIIKHGDSARIIFISSRAHYRAKTSLVPLNIKREEYNRFECYNRSKLANAMYANYLAKTLAPSGIKTASVHPGVVQTDLFRFLGIFSFIPNFLTRPFMKTPWEGTQTTLYTVLSPNLISGAYYSDCVEMKALPIVYDQTAGENLANASRKAVGML